MGQSHGGHNLSRAEGERPASRSNRSHDQPVRAAKGGAFRPNQIKLTLSSFTERIEHGDAATLRND
jgi:hypothetical protein